MKKSERPRTRPLAVITGASSGIGYELAKIFAGDGFDLLIAADSQKIHRVAKELRAFGVEVESVQTDLTTYEGVEKLAASIQATGCPVDSIALNAGVGVGGEFARDTDLDDELRLIDLNVKSTVHLTKRILQPMVDRDFGRILFTSSIASTHAGPFEAVYAASKAFVQSFSQALRNELKDTGITITSLMPGPTETHFFQRAGMEDTRIGVSKKDDAALVARQGYEALMAGKDQVVAGSLKNRLMAAAARFLPESVKAEAHRHLAEPGSGVDEDKKSGAA